MAKVLLGAKAAASRDDVVGFWESVAFYNYVQEFVGDHPRDRPTSAQWEQAGKVLPTVLTTLRPHFVLACGRQLYEHLKTVPDLTSAPVFGADNLTRSREIALGTTEHGVVGLIYHPASRGFRAAAWVSRVNEYLARARQPVILVEKAGPHKPGNSRSWKDPHEA